VCDRACAVGVCACGVCGVTGEEMKKEVFKDGSRYTERPWGTGDVVGAGINKDTIFFTRNGKRLGACALTARTARAF